MAISISEPEAQHNELPEDEEITAADRLIIDLPTTTGLILLKALAPEPGLDAAGLKPRSRRRAAGCRRMHRSRKKNNRAPAPMAPPQPRGKR